MSASKGYFAISRESEEGVEVTTPAQFYPVQSVDFPYEKAFTENFEIRGSNQAVSSEPGLVEGQASISGLFYPAGAGGTLLRALFGAVDSEAYAESSPAYRHAFTSGTLGTYTLERADAFASEGGKFAERIAGAKMERFALECQTGEAVTFSADFQAMGAPKVRSAVARPQTPGFWNVGKALSFTGARILVDGELNSSFTSLSMELTNNLQRQPVLNGQLDGHPIDHLGFTATLSGSAAFRNMDLRNLLEAGTEFSVEFSIHNNVVATGQVMEGVSFEFPLVKLASVGIPMQANEAISSDVQFRMDFDDAINALVEAEMINKESGTAYA